MSTEDKVGAFVLSCLAVLTSTVIYLLNAQSRRNGEHLGTLIAIHLGHTDNVRTVAYQGSIGADPLATY